LPGPLMDQVLRANLLRIGRRICANEYRALPLGRIRLPNRTQLAFCRFELLLCFGEQEVRPELREGR